MKNPNRQACVYLVGMDPRDVTKIIEATEHGNAGVPVVVWFTLLTYAVKKDVRALTFDIAKGCLARSAGISKRTVDAALDQLKRCGLLSWKQNSTARQHLANTFTICPTTDPLRTRVAPAHTHREGDANPARGYSKTREPRIALLLNPAKSGGVTEAGSNGGLLPAPACLPAAGGEVPPEGNPQPSPSGGMEQSKKKRRFDEYGDPIQDEGGAA